MKKKLLRERRAEQPIEVVVEPEAKPKKKKDK